MSIVTFILGFIFALVLVHFYPRLGSVIAAIIGWVMTKLGRSTPTIIAMFSVMLLATTLQACAKQKADAYICGEPPNEVTFYCKPGTGPPRNDCGLPQSGEFDKDPITC